MSCLAAVQKRNTQINALLLLHTLISELDIGSKSGLFRILNVIILQSPVSSSWSVLCGILDY